MLRRLVFVLLLLAPAARLPAAGPLDGLTPAQRGYCWLVDKPYLPPDFDQETFDNVWRHWPEPLRSQAQEATHDQRRTLAFARYGLTPRPDDPTRPLQYVVDERGQWTMNCLACHGGLVPALAANSSPHAPREDSVTRSVTPTLSVVWPGAPNSLFALQTLTEETRLVKAELQKPLTRMDLGSVFVPLGSTNGTTNAVMFGVVLMGYRDADLNVRTDRPLPKMTHHDMDAPPWWHFKRKRMIYIDGFAEKGHRGLMQFMLVKSNGPEKFRQWERDFQDVFAFISSIEPPQYPFAIDAELAQRGCTVFNRVCADCHGTYGAGGSYPEKRIPIDEVRTNRVRLDALTPTHRDAYGQSWFADYGRKANLTEPGGYVAPPLDGVWASGPYFHNGSVPTLWHVLHPSARPVIWKRSAERYDTDRVGPQIETFEELPFDANEGWQRRQYFDTRRFGKSAAGHDFPDALSEDEKRAVLEYLKSL